MSTNQQTTGYTQKTIVRCNYTGIAYTINTELYSETGGIHNSNAPSMQSTRPVLPNLGVILQHPMSHMNTVKQSAPLFSANKIGNTLAAGALFTILQHHKLLVLHDTDTIYAANIALCEGFTQAALNRLVYRWLTNEKCINIAKKRSRAAPQGSIAKFDIGTVNPSCGEYRDEHHYFIACFKTWMYEVLQPTQEEIMRASAINTHQEKRKADIAASIGNFKDVSAVIVANVADSTAHMGHAHYNSQFGQSVIDYDSNALDTIIANVINEAAKSRRKSHDQIITKIRGHLAYAEKLSMFTASQYDHLRACLVRQKIQPNVFEATCTIYERYIIQHERAVTVPVMGSAAASGMTTKRRVLKVIEILAWFKLLQGIFNDTDASSFTVEGKVTVETEAIMVVRDNENNMILDEVAETLPPTASLMDMLK